ncbi:sensor histidine kinase [Clostridium paraputrificum]|uniref:sensor histidine kinase n=1 Tax=Clostridium paraputrificum TaxID=29363 RepID=UPI001FAE4705|nr:sensor histidine kinase [Clostridium paraputrificum]
MDTKLKNNKKSLLLSVIVGIIILAISIGMVSFYPKMVRVAKEKSLSVNPYIDYSLQKYMYDSSMVLYKNLLEKENDKNIVPSDIFIKDRENDSYDINDYKENIDRKVYNAEDLLKKGIKNLDYIIINNKSGFEISKGEDNIKKIVKDELISEDEYYGYYIVVKYDEDGNYKIADIKGAEKDVITNLFYGLEWNKYSNNGSVTVSGPKDVTIAYGIPKVLEYDDPISYRIENSDRIAYGDISLLYGGALAVIIIILALFTPSKIWSRCIGIKNILRIPFEILVVLLTCMISLIALLPMLVYEYGNNIGNFIEIMNGIGVSQRPSEIIFMLGNILGLSIVVYGIYLAIIVIKNIFYVGVKEYFKTKSLIGMLLLKSKVWIKEGYNRLIEIDLNDKSNKTLIKILGVNFIVLSIMCSIWFFGIGISIAYTIVLFFVLKKYFDEVKQKYSILLKATNKIAEGNLDVEIKEDLGLFNPLKGELEKIQSGFKKAVEEEVKSQRLKTELISNVSHDLKTPLTSIITYVDLLKNENITEEERKSYIETIERKSERLKNLIEDLFEMSKATSKNIQLNIVEVDIVELMKQTQFELSDKIEESSLKFKWNLPNEKVIIKLDSQKTFRVFENLLMNIVKYAMPNSRVFIDIINEEDKVSIVLKNMSANEMDFTAEEIVERFARGDRSRNTEGSGLGLAISKSFVELQGGSFKIEIDGDLFKVKIDFNK